MGRVIAGEALRIYGKARPISGEGVRFRQGRPLAVPANKGRPEDVPLAEKYVRAHREGRDDLIPETAWRDHAGRGGDAHPGLKDAPDNFELNRRRWRSAAFVWRASPARPLPRWRKEHQGGFALPGRS